MSYFCFFLGKTHFHFGTLVDSKSLQISNQVCTEFSLNIFVMWFKLLVHLLLTNNKSTNSSNYSPMALFKAPTNPLRRHNSQFRTMLMMIMIILLKTYLLNHSHHVYLTVMLFFNVHT